MVGTTPWARNLRLLATDAIFDGQEAAAMRRLLGLDSGAGRHPRPCSFAEQARLAESLSERGRLQDALSVSASLGLRDFGSAGLAVLFAPTLSDLERCLRNFAPLLNLRHKLTVRRVRDDLRFFIDELTPTGDVCSALLRMLDQAKLGRFLADLLERQGVSSSSAQQWPLPRCDDGYPIPEALASRLRRTNQSEFRRQEKAARKLMKEIEHAQIGVTVRRILLSESGAGDRLPELAEVARQLGYSQRTFRRRLTERGTSFMDCVNDVRQQMALRYLATTTFTVEAIAERLGYSDTSNFRHAFRRWTGVSPKAYVARATADLPVTVMRTHCASSARTRPVYGNRVAF